MSGYDRERRYIIRSQIFEHRDPLFELPASVRISACYRAVQPLSRKHQRGFSLSNRSGA